MTCFIQHMCFNQKCLKRIKHFICSMIQTDTHYWDDLVHLIHFSGKCFNELIRNLFVLYDSKMLVHNSSLRVRKHFNSAIQTGSDFLELSSFDSYQWKKFQWINSWLICFIRNMCFTLKMFSHAAQVWE